MEEAGGRVSDFKGGHYSPFLREILATNSLIHAELVALIEGFGEQ